MTHPDTTPLATVTGPSGRRLLWRVTLLLALSALVNVVVFGFFLARLLDWTPDVWRTFAVMVGIGIVLLPVIAQRFQPSLRALCRWLDRRSGSPEEDLRAFAATIGIGREVLRNSLLLWPLSALAVAVAMRLLEPSVSVLDGLTLLAAGSFAAVFSLPAVSFLIQREVAPIRRHLALAIDDPDRRASAVRGVAIGVRLQGTVLVTTLIPVFAMLCVAHREVATAVDSFAHARQQEWLATAAGAVGRGVTPAGAPVSPTAGRWLLLDDGGRTLAAGGASAAALDPAALGSLAAETGSGRTGSELFAWQRVAPEGPVLVALLPTHALGAGPGALSVELAMLLATGLVLACSAAWLMGREIGRGIAALRVEAGRIAAGDLSRPEVFESDDELGELARAFDRMRHALRETVARVAQAADRVDHAAAELGAVGSAVATAAGEQERAITQARESTDTVQEQAGGITASAQELSASVEESSSSILEMGAAGEELSQTASLLSGKVDEVSTSIEQMIRSVTGMARNVDGLSDAALETQSSVDEMAGSMREVNTNAAETARLSAQVVSVAEGGREKVQETIAGMEAIRDATDTVEQVIRGLGGRAKEIGAIVDVIDDVADETNLLALNAAIIAAQAGEHGRAFSVVAEEIKELADRVMASTKEIGSLIRSVQDESSAAIAAIERGSASVWTGVERSAEAGESLEAITRTARESGQRIAEIVHAVQEQARAADHVRGLMDRVRVSIDQLRHATGEQEQGNEVVLRGTSTMRDVAQQVHRTTEEQARGGNQIRSGIEVVRQAVERIDQALQDQAAACRQSAAFMGRVSDAARANHEAAAQAEHSAGELRAAAGTLREEIQRFRL